MDVNGTARNLQVGCWQCLLPLASDVGVGLGACSACAGEGGYYALRQGQRRRRVLPDCLQAPAHLTLTYIDLHLYGAQQRRHKHYSLSAIDM